MAEAEDDNSSIRKWLQETGNKSSDLEWWESLDEKEQRAKWEVAVAKESVVIASPDTFKTKPTPDFLFAAIQRNNSYGVDNVKRVYFMPNKKNKKLETEAQLEIYFHTSFFNSSIDNPASIVIEKKGEYNFSNRKPFRDPQTLYEIEEYVGEMATTTWLSDNYETNNAISPGSEMIQEEKLELYPKELPGMDNSLRVISAGQQLTVFFDNSGMLDSFSLSDFLGRNSSGHNIFGKQINLIESHLRRDFNIKQLLNGEPFIRDDFKAALDKDTQKIVITRKIEEKIDEDTGKIPAVVIAEIPTKIDIPEAMKRLFSGKLLDEPFEIGTQDDIGWKDTKLTDTLGIDFQPLSENTIKELANMKKHFNPDEEDEN